MNVSYKELNTVDVAKALKLDKTTVAAWCRKGYINFIDVSEPGSSKPRYQIPQWEFDRVQKLIRKFGKRQWMLYNAKDKERAAQEHMTKVEKVEENPDDQAKQMLNAIADGETGYMFIDKPELEPIPLKTASDMTFDMEKIAEEKEKTKFNPDKIMNTILYIQEIKERLNDLETEKNQLLAELEQCRKEVIDVI